MVGEVTLENICLSGGADNSDLQWGMMAGRLGHKVVHWSFQGHRTDAPPAELVQLSQNQLEEADRFIERANRAIRRNWPSRTTSTNNLLRRNWYQVKDTGAVYAVGNMEDRAIKGGTAWAVQMYMDRFLYDGEPLEKCQLYFYDQTTFVWWQWRGQWEIRVSQPPMPQGVWTGIGTRDLTSDGKWMIRKVMGGYPVADAQIAAVHPLITEPKVADIIYVPNGKDDEFGKQLGGWAYVNRILDTGDDLWIAITEYANTYFRWSELAPQQSALRSQFGLDHACTK
jgi:hypothetical protein